ncbi:MAG TPA: hypothetical protein VHG28_11880 [Longimicrobiaceae bacterium]|nr:hypothetical protein [Longimicrobiaceae bacterium]
MAALFARSLFVKFAMRGVVRMARLAEDADGDPASVREPGMTGRKVLQSP